MRPRYSKDAPDLMSAIVAETRRRKQAQLIQNNSPTDHYANDRTPRAPPARPAFSATIIFAILFSAVLLFSTIIGAALGLVVVALFFAFLLAPLSTPFFLLAH